MFINQQLRYKVEIILPSNDLLFIDDRLLSDTSERVEERALEWIVENVDCLWSFERRLNFPIKELMLRYSFSDLSTATLFRLAF
jgi:hypothetical protein